jgi:hypothetical protein
MILIGVIREGGVAGKEDQTTGFRANDRTARKWLVAVNAIVRLGEAQGPIRRVAQWV